MLHPLQVKEFLDRRAQVPTHIFKAAGTTFEGRQDKLRLLIAHSRFEEGEGLHKQQPPPLWGDEPITSPFTRFPDFELKLTFEPDNAYDDHAIAIMVDNMHIGYVPRRRCHICGWTWGGDNASTLVCPKCSAETVDQQFKSYFNRSLWNLMEFDHVKDQRVLWIGTTKQDGFMGLGVGLVAGNDEWLKMWQHFWSDYTKAYLAAENDNQLYDHSTRRHWETNAKAASEWLHQNPNLRPPGGLRLPEIYEDANENPPA